MKIFLWVVVVYYLIHLLDQLGGNLSKAPAAIDLNTQILNNGILGSEDLKMNLYEIKMK